MPALIINLKSDSAHFARGAGGVGVVLADLAARETNPNCVRKPSPNPALDTVTSLHGAGGVRLVLVDLAAEEMLTLTLIFWDLLQTLIPALNLDQPSPRGRRRRRRARAR